MPNLPKDFPVTTCGSDSSAAAVNGAASDASRFIAGGSNYVHMELSGNTPPYKNDPVTKQLTISGLGDIHLDIIVNKLKERKGLK